MEDREALPFEMRWEPIESADGEYSPRTGHTVVTHEGSFYLFGGTDRRRRQQDLYKYDVSARAWTRLRATGHLPSRRSGALGAVLDGSLYVFGGYDGRDGNYFNDLYKLDFASLEWTLVRPRNRTLMDVVLEGSPTDDENAAETAGSPTDDNGRAPTNERVPQPRTDHSMVAFGHKLIVFGGYDGSERFNNTFEFDTLTLKWRELCVASCPRGGDPTSQGPEALVHPTRRFGHTGVVHGGKLWIFGGWDGRETLDCIYALDLKTERWSTLAMLRAARRRKQLARRRSTFGGSRRRAEPFVGSKRRFSLVGRADRSGSESSGSVENQARAANRPRRGLWDGVCRTLSGPPAAMQAHMILMRRDSGQSATQPLPGVSARDSELVSEAEVEIEEDNTESFDEATRGEFADSIDADITELPGENASKRREIYEDEEVEDGDEEEEEEEDDDDDDDDDAMMDIDESTCDLASAMEALQRSPHEAWPHNRYRHSAVLCGDNMVIFGGVDKQHRRFNDVFKFSFAKLEWEHVQAEGVEPSSRTFHRAICVDDYMYILGGYDGEDRLNDMHRVYLGRLSPAPLAELCASYIRRNVAHLSRRGGVFEAIAPMVLETDVWTRDQGGELRGGRHDADGKQVCARFASSPFAFDESNQMGAKGLEGLELDLCTGCKATAAQHELIHEEDLFMPDPFWQPDAEELEAAHAGGNKGVLDAAAGKLAGRHAGNSSGNSATGDDRASASIAPHALFKPRRLLRNFARFRAQTTDRESNA